MLQNDSHLNCLCVMARLIEALAIFVFGKEVLDLLCKWKMNVQKVSGCARNSD